MGLLDWLQDPRRTQAMQGIGSAIQSGLLNIQQGNERFQGLASRALADPMNPAKVTDPQAFNELSKMAMGLLSFAPVGLTVFHGSPAKFQKFDPTKIGSGEGAQAYGYGHYVAESPDVAKSYAANVSNKQGTRTFAPASNAVQNSINYFKAMLKNEVPRDVKNGVEVSDDYIKSQIAQLTDQLPSVYKIDLPDEQIAKMLDWDKPLSEQPKNVREALQKLKTHPAMSDPDLQKWLASADDKPGRSIYSELSMSDKLANPAEVSSLLREAGIPGIRYLDEGSRSKFQVQNTYKGQLYGEPVSFMTEKQAKDYAAEQIQKGFGAELLPGTSNFVVFPGNEDLLRILERNNQPLSLLD